MHMNRKMVAGKQGKQGRREEGKTGRRTRLEWRGNRRLVLTTDPDAVPVRVPRLLFPVRVELRVCGQIMDARDHWINRRSNSESERQISRQARSVIAK